MNDTATHGPSSVTFNSGDGALNTTSSPSVKKPAHLEHHRFDRVAWLRATVLGANDGIVSTASLLVGVAAAGANSTTLTLTGIAGLVAGAMSMAAGEYVSVKAQSDSEAADLLLEKYELETEPEHELEELKNIYIMRGLDPDLALQVAVQLTEKDALGAHARDELGLTDEGRAQPVLAAVSSAIAFSVGAGLPLAAAVFAPLKAAALATVVTSLIALAILGTASAVAGGASPLRPTARVVFWGALAMAATFTVGSLFGVRMG